MRLLTHNVLRNNAADANGKGFPLKITATEVKVIEDEEFDESRAAFIRGMLPSLDWGTLVQAASEVGVPTLPPALTEDLVRDTEFIRALYHVLVNIRMVRGVLTCPITGREFPVMDGIPAMMLQEEECEAVR